MDYSKHTVTLPIVDYQKLTERPAMTKDQVGELYEKLGHYQAQIHPEGNATLNVYGGAPYSHQIDKLLIRDRNGKVMKAFKLELISKDEYLNEEETN